MAASFVDNIIVNVSPNNVWGFFLDNLFDVDEHSALIALNKENGVEIYLSCRNQMPVIEVYINDNFVTDEVIYDESDATETLRQIYSDYLMGRTVQEEYDDEYISEDELDQLSYEIESRDFDLLEAFTQFMDVVCAYDENYDDSRWDLEDTLDDVLSIIGDSGYHIYRPRLYENEDGSIEVDEFPYDEYDEDF